MFKNTIFLLHRWERTTNQVFEIYIKLACHKLDFARSLIKLAHCGAVNAFRISFEDSCAMNIQLAA